MDSSMVFARAPVYTPPNRLHAALGQLESKSQTASRSVQPFFAQLTAYSRYTLQQAAPFPIAAFLWGSEPHLIHGPSDPRESSTRTASRLVQPFLHRSPQSVPILYNGRSLPPQNCPFPWGSGLVPWAHQVRNPNGTSIRSAVFVELTSVTDKPTNRPTDHATRSATRLPPRIRTAMWPNIVI